MTHRLSNDFGFSLIETMVATFLFALVSASGVMLLTGYQDGREMLAAADDRIAGLAVTRAVMKADLIAALDRPARGEMGDSQGFLGSAYLPDGLKLRFVRGGSMRAVLNGGTSALERVDYLLLDDKLVRRSYDRTDVTPGSEAHDRVLLSGVEKLSLRFESDGMWREEWRPDIALAQLPNLAELTLVMAGGRELRFVLMVGGQA